MDDHKVILSTKEVIQYYLNNSFELIYNDAKDERYVDIIYGFYNASFGFSFGTLDTQDYFDLEDFFSVKPILKHPADMWKEKEIEREYYLLCKKIHCCCWKNVFTADTPNSIIFAINKGYDMFDLIERGQAIDFEDKPQQKIKK